MQGVSVKGVGCLLCFAAIYQRRSVRQAELSNVHLDKVEVLLAKVAFLCELLRVVVLPRATPWHGCAWHTHRVVRVGLARSAVRGRHTSAAAVARAKGIELRQKLGRTLVPTTIIGMPWLLARTPSSKSNMMVSSPSFLASSWSSVYERNVFISATKRASQGQPPGRTVHRRSAPSLNPRVHQGSGFHNVGPRCCLFCWSMDAGCSMGRTGQGKHDRLRSAFRVSRISSASSPSRWSPSTRDHLHGRCHGAKRSR